MSFKDMSRNEFVEVYSQKVRRVKAGSAGRIGMVNAEIAALKCDSRIPLLDLRKSELVRVSANVVKRVR